jgi:hypothetical protein
MVTEMTEKEDFDSYAGIYHTLDNRFINATKEGWTPARMICDAKTFEIFRHGLHEMFFPNEPIPDEACFLDLCFPNAGYIRLYLCLQKKGERYIEAKRALNEERTVIESCRKCGNPTFYLEHDEKESYPNGTKFLPQIEISLHYLVCTKCFEKQELE